jgi:hypothetical protein
MERRIYYRKAERHERKQKLGKQKAERGHKLKH